MWASTGMVRVRACLGVDFYWSRAFGQVRGQEDLTLRLKQPLWTPGLRKPERGLQTVEGLPAT